MFAAGILGPLAFSSLLNFLRTLLTNSLITVKLCGKMPLKGWIKCFCGYSLFCAASYEILRWTEATLSWSFAQWSEKTGDDFVWKGRERAEWSWFRR